METPRTLTYLRSLTELMTILDGRFSPSDPEWKHRVEVDSSGLARIHVVSGERYASFTFDPATDNPYAMVVELLPQEEKLWV